MKHAKYRNYIKSIGYEEVNESIETVYHGSNTLFTKIEPKYMFLETSNAQEGVGLYFGDLKTAQSYGKYVYKLEINSKYFKTSRGYVDGGLPKAQFKKFMLELWKLDPEVMFLWCTDYGVYAEVKEDVNVRSINEFIELIQNEELRNLQVDVTQRFGVEAFVKLWMKCFKNVHGLYNDEYRFYTVLSTNYKLEKI